MEENIKSFTDAEMQAMVKEIARGSHQGARRSTVREREMTPDEIKEALGALRAVKINFVPMMLGTLAVEEATKMLDYAAAHKVSDIKKHSRLMRATIADYHKAVTYAYGPAYGSFKYYNGRFMEEVGADVFKMELEADTVAKNCKARYPGVAAFAMLVVLLVDAADLFDDESDKAISKVTGKLTKRRKDIYLESLAAICADILEHKDHRAEPNQALKMWAGVIRNRANYLVEDIVREEDEEEKRGD